MNPIVRRIVNKVMAAFAGAGIGLDDDGRLHLPDGLSADRVHRFIEICTDRRFGSPREAMHTLFVEIGVSAKAVRLLDRIIDDRGDVDFGRATRVGPQLLAELPELHRIPELFREFLIDDLGLAPAECETLAAAVVATREAAADHVGCAATWDAILKHETALAELARPWRERSAPAPSTSPVSMGAPATI